MDKPTYIVLDARESLLASIIRDAVTFGLMLLCIWVSQGSRWWTFFSALFLIAWLGIKAMSLVNDRQLRFNSIEKLSEWVEAEQAKAPARP